MALLSSLGRWRVGRCVRQKPRSRLGRLIGEMLLLEDARAPRGEVWCSAEADARVATLEERIDLAWNGRSRVVWISGQSAQHPLRLVVGPLANSVVCDSTRPPRQFARSSCTARVGPRRSTAYSCAPPGARYCVQPPASGGASGLAAVGQGWVVGAHNDARMAAVIDVAPHPTAASTAPSNRRTRCSRVQFFRPHPPPRGSLFS